MYLHLLHVRRAATAGYVVDLKAEIRVVDQIILQSPQTQLQMVHYIWLVE